MKNNAFLFVLLLLMMKVDAQQKNATLLVGTYTTSCKSDGIYVYDFNIDTAEFKLKQSTAKQDVANPSYLTVSSNGDAVYSVNENGKNSSVSGFKFDANSGKLDFVNKQNSEGADPCFIINDDKNVIVANYSGGTISVFPKNGTGSIGAAKQVVTHRGNSIDKKRQESPHVHMVQFSPDKKFVLANDLGTDRIYVYDYNAESDKEVLSFKDTIPIKTGSGPRHLTFSPNGKFVYLLQELDATVTVFAFINGKLKRIQQTTVASNYFTGENGAADIHISEDGSFLYATNRGDANTISLFEIGANGKLFPKTTISSGGKGPRNFVIVPGGNFVLVAHQNSNDVVIFQRDAETGELTNTGKKIELCSPVCLVFAPQK